MIYDSQCRQPYERVLCQCQCRNLLRPSPLSWLKKNDDLTMDTSLRDGGEDLELFHPSSTSNSASVSPPTINSSATNSAGGSNAALSSSTNTATLSAGNLIDDGKFLMPFSKPIKIGEQWLLCGRRKSSFPFQCMVGPDWPMVILVYTLIISVNALVLGLASPCLGWPVLLTGLGGALILLIAYTTVACSDPGIIYKELDDEASEFSDIEGAPREGINDTTDADVAGIADSGNMNTSPAGSESGSVTSSTTPILNVRPSSNYHVQGSNKNVQIIHGVPCKTTMECGQCQLQRPYSARHCVYCGVCVDELDHHCPWCGKCIGASNMAAFSAFVGMLCLQGYLLAGIFIYWIVTCFIVSGPHGEGFSQ